MLKQEVRDHDNDIEFDDGATAVRPRQSPLVLAGVAPLELARQLDVAKTAAIRSRARLIVEEDETHGIPAKQRIYCDACCGARPLGGASLYERYTLCSTCALEYEVARARGLVRTVGCFVRDKRFGEAAIYALGGPTEAR
jgi:hypothetical protein